MTTTAELERLCLLIRHATLKMRTRPLRNAHAPNHVTSESKAITFFLNPRPQVAYSLYNFYWATTTIKSRLLSSRFRAKKILNPLETGPKNGGLGKMGVQTLDIGFATPKRHFLARNRVV